MARLRLWVSSLYLPVCMTTLRTKIIRLAHQNPALRPHLLPLLKEAALKVASKKPLYGHDKMDNAYVVDDYPYGSLRTKIRFWLEKSPSKGFRFVSQTLNPKTGKWNAPKPSTYAKIGGQMFLDDKNHVVWNSITEYTSATDVEDFLKDFPQTDKAILKKWVPMKVAYYKKLVELNEKGLSGWAMNGQPVPLTDQDKESNLAQLKAWESAQKHL